MPGSWTDWNIDKDGFYAGSARVITELSATLTADASAATIPNKTFAHDVALLVGFGVLFDGTTPPDALTLTIKDQHGLTVATATSLTASGRATLTNPVALVNGGTISASGNTTNSAKATVYLYVMPNYR